MKISNAMQHLEYGGEEDSFYLINFWKSFQGLMQRSFDNKLDLDLMKQMQLYLLKRKHT